MTSNLVSSLEKDPRSDDWTCDPQLALYFGHVRFRAASSWRHRHSWVWTVCPVLPIQIATRVHIWMGDRCSGGSGWTRSAGRTDVRSRRLLDEQLDATHDNDSGCARMA